MLFRIICSRRRILPPNSTSSSCDSATPVPSHHRCGRLPRLLPYVYVPAGAERAARRRLRREPVPPPRARPSRRLRRLLARSRSAGSSTRECSYRHAYERSHSCPDYPVHVNTYKITENRKDYIFQVALPPRHTHIVPNSSANREQRRVAPINVPHYGPPLSAKPLTHQHKRKSQLREESTTAWHSVRPQSFDCSFYQQQKPKDIGYGFYQQQKPKETKRRKLPDIERIQSIHLRSLPNIPSVSLENKKDEKSNITTATGNRVENSTQNEETTSQYHGYDSDGSEAETTIHVSIEKQMSADNGKCDPAHEPAYTDSRRPSLASITAGNDRKKFLSLDLKTSYEPVSSIQSQSLDIPEPDDNKVKRITKQPSENNNIQKPNTAPKPKDNSAIRRRHSDSLMLRKCTPESRTTPDEIRDIFKKMSISSNNKSNEFLDSVTKKEESEKNSKRPGNVSINEIPSFQEYCSPSSLFPQSCLDLPVLKPLPSIIKKARTRSHSLASTYHLDHELSIMANTVFIALSPPNLGSPRRVLTPVASHLPLDDIHHNIHTAATESLTSDQSTTGTETQPAQPMAQRNCNRTNSDRNKKQSGKKHRGKSGPRRESKRSNDYGGRENGRGNGQPQPLERRESRRGQFTRSLSNADVPPDEKAGKH